MSTPPTVWKPVPVIPIDEAKVNQISEEDAFVQMVWWDQALKLLKVVNKYSIGGGSNNVYLKVFPTGGIELWSMNDKAQAVARWQGIKEADKGLKTVLKTFINKAVSDAADFAMRAANLERDIKEDVAQYNAGNLDE